MRKLSAAVIAFALIAPAALGSSKATIKASPSPIQTGQKLKVSGSNSGCTSPVTIYSRAFTSNQKFDGIPAITTPIKNGAFSAKIKVTTNSSGAYRVSARCKPHGKFGSVKVQVLGAY